MNTIINETDISELLKITNTNNSLSIDELDITEKTRSIISLFAEIAKPFKDNEGGPKLDAIQAWLNSRNISNEYIPGIGKIVNKVDNPRLILVSHIDLIRKFQKGFEAGNTHEIVNSKKEVPMIKGALDNTITNSVALLAIEDLIKNGITDIELLLTEGEEVGLIGMRKYLEVFSEKSANAFFVNLDVTNEGWKKNSSVEYDKPSFSMLKQLQAILSDHNAYFTHNRVCDDVDAINRSGCSGFSYCLPTKDLIHSYDNKAYIHTLEGYLEGLISLLTKIELKEDMNITFSSWHFSKALKTDDKITFESLISEKINEFQFTSKNRYYDETEMLSRYDFDDNDLPFSREDKNEISKPITSKNRKDRLSLLEATLKWVNLSKLNKKEQEEINSFIEHHLLNDESFMVPDLALCLQNIKNPIKETMSIIDDLIESGSLFELSTDKYKFQRAEEIDF
jgi:hypothetical protein